MTQLQLLQNLLKAGVEVDVSDTIAAQSEINRCLTIILSAVTSIEDKIDWLDEVAFLDEEDGRNRIYSRRGSMLVIYNPRRFSMETLRNL